MKIVHNILWKARQLLSHKFILLLGFDALLGNFKSSFSMELWPQLLRYYVVSNCSRDRVAEHLFHYLHS